MMTKKPQSAAVEEEDIEPLPEDARITERPDGFYWQSTLTEKFYGPFPTLLEAREDAQYHEEGDFDEGASLQEAEEEFGASEWFDPGTGEFTEDSSPHLCDEF